MTISEDDAGSLILAVNGIRTILTEEDEAALLERLLDRAGGLQNLWVEEQTAAEVRTMLRRGGESR